jgi:drug/metabolite transporter (DMT)-like permease
MMESGWFWGRIVGMSWFFIALGAPALWGLVNHVDKYIISRFFKGDRGVGSLVIFTSFSGLVMSVFIAIFFSHSLVLNVVAAFIIALNGAILVASFIPYMYAIEHEEASFVTALFQMIPVFTYVLRS